MAKFNFDTSKFTTNLNSVQDSVSKKISSAGSKFNALVDNLSQGGMSSLGIGNFIASSNKNSILKSDPRVSPEVLLTGRSKNYDDDTSPEKLIKSTPNIINDIFPADLSDEFFFQLELADYKRPNPSTADSTFDTEYTLNLPLPVELQENHTVMLNATDSGIFGAAAGEVQRIADSLSNLNDPLRQKADPGKEASTSLNNAAGIGYYLARDALSLAGGPVAGIAGQALGAVPNPHMTVFFEGVNLRSAIEFSWLLAPRNNDEANRVSKIIKELRKRILPRPSTGNQNILSYPKMARITLYPWGQDKDPSKQKWMPTYKRGLIESMNVNWAPAGISLFNDQEAAPAFCIVSFVFQEIEIFTSSDYGGTATDITDFPSRQNSEK